MQADQFCVQTGQLVESCLLPCLDGLISRFIFQHVSERSKSVSGRPWQKVPFFSVFKQLNFVSGQIYPRANFWDSTFACLDSLLACPDRLRLKFVDMIFSSFSLSLSLSLSLPRV
jgi:hypothetical protein